MPSRVELGRGPQSSSPRLLRKHERSTLNSERIREQAAQLNSL
jgi:hypothetical protein